jgi:hypothetical protein
MSAIERLNYPDPVREVLESGLDDWVMATEVWDIVTRVYSLDVNSTRLLCEGLTSYIVGEELMVPGQVNEHGFRPFEPTTARNLERLHDEWARVDRLPEFGEVAWFAITPKGRESAPLDDVAE